MFNRKQRLKDIFLTAAHQAIRPRRLPGNPCLKRKNRPGGGVKNGSSTQEESLCKCSTLFPTIDRKWLYEKYYAVNCQARDNRHTDASIYSPGVIICKTDGSIPQRMPEKEFVTVDVISGADRSNFDAFKKRMGSL